MITPGILLFRCVLLVSDNSLLLPPHFNISICRYRITQFPQSGATWIETQPSYPQLSSDFAWFQFRHNGMCYVVVFEVVTATIRQYVTLYYMKFKIATCFGCTGQSSSCSVFQKCEKKINCHSCIIFFVTFLKHAA
jgi:hypothetical protein